LPPTPATGVKVSSLFELCARAVDHEARLGRLVASGSPDGGGGTAEEGVGDEALPPPMLLPPPRLAVHAELEAALSGAAGRAVIALAARLAPTAEWLFARALDEGARRGGGGGPPPAAAGRVAALAGREVARLADLLSPAALVAAARATAWVLAGAAEAVLLAPGPPGLAPLSEGAVTALVRAAEAGSAALGAACARAGVPPPHPGLVAASLDRLGALGTLALAPTPAVEDAADELWAAAAARAAHARARSGLLLGRGEGEGEDGSTATNATAPPRPSSPHNNHRRPGAGAPPGLAYLDALRILRARAAGGDEEAGAAARLRAAHAASQVREERDVHAQTAHAKHAHTHVHF